MKTAFAAYQKEKQEKKKKKISPKKKETKEIKVTEIPISTLGSVLRSLGLNPTQAALKSYADWLDADPKDGVVKFDELLIIVGREKKVLIDESHVLEVRTKIFQYIVLIHRLLHEGLLWSHRTARMTLDLQHANTKE